MKKNIFLITLFVAYSTIINICPVITQWDRYLIVHIQEILKPLPLTIPLLPDCALYSAMIAIPLIFGAFWFVKKNKYLDCAILLSVPLSTFLLNCIVKPIIQRPRPPYELQQIIHPDSFSYVSSHSLVTFCLWGMIIYYFYKYSKNKVLNNIVTAFAILWTLFVGLSRIWLGVHNPSDVLGAYILGFILVNLYILTEIKLNK